MGKHSIQTEENYSNAKTKKRTKHVNGFAIFVLIVIICAAAVAGFFAPRISDTIEKLGGGKKGIVAMLLGQNEETRKNLDKIYIVLIGESGVDEYKQSDTLMIASYDPKAQKAAIMSIPRDTYVGPSNTAKATYKINSRYANGEKMDLLLSDLKQITGLDLKYYIRIDTNALVNLVDLIGGVEFDVPIDMKYDDAGQKLHINLKKGMQLINGEKAEQLLRFRHNNNGTTYSYEYGAEDFGRMRTQRAFITATLSKALKIENVTKINELINIGYENLKTNIDMDKLKDYVPDLLEFDIANLETDVLPGQSVLRDGLWIFEYNKAQTKAKVQQMFIGTETQSTATPNTTTQTNK